jgi:hypothetical protein
MGSDEDYSETTQQLKAQGEELNRKFFRTLEYAQKVSMALDYAKHIWDPNLPYTPTINTPGVSNLLRGVNKDSSFEDKQAAVHRLREELNDAKRAHEQARTEIENFFAQQ